MDVDLGPVHLEPVPTQQFLILFLEGGGRSRVEHASQLVGLFVQVHAVAPLAQQQGYLHAGNTAADNGNLLGVPGLLQGILLFLKGHRVQGAVALGGSILQVHNGAGILVVGHGQAGVVTGNTGTDFLFPALFQLRQVFAVTQ